VRRDGRGTQTQVCRRAAEAEVAWRLTYDESDQYDEHHYWSDVARLGLDGVEGTMAYNQHGYHEKDTYINPNLAGQGACVSPRNLLRLGGELVRPRHFHTTLHWYHDTTWTDQANNIVNGVPFQYPNHHSLNQQFSVWFGKGNDLETNLAAWPKTVCSDGGEGSVRIPFEFGVDESTQATVDTKFFYDFGCPYGSQPEACPPREGLEEYQQTMDKLDQPEGPVFANCFDNDVPDYE